MSTSKRKSLYSESFGQFNEKLFAGAEKINAASPEQEKKDEPITEDVKSEDKKPVEKAAAKPVKAEKPSPGEDKNTTQEPKEEPAVVIPDSSVIDDSAPEDEKIRGTRSVRMVSVMVEDPETGEIHYEKRKKENKTSQLTVLVTASENRLIRQKAKENDVTLNQYLRDIILRHIQMTSK